MRVGQSWEFRDVTVEDWIEVGAALGLDADDATSRVNHLRAGLPDALAAAAELAPSQFTKDAHRVAAAIARQSHVQSAPRRRTRRT